MKIGRLVFGLSLIFILAFLAHPAYAASESGENNANNSIRTVVTKVIGFLVKNLDIFLSKIEEFFGSRTSVAAQIIKNVIAEIRKTLEDIRNNFPTQEIPLTDETVKKILDLLEWTQQYIFEILDEAAIDMTGKDTFKENVRQFRSILNDDLIGKSRYFDDYLRVVAEFLEQEFRNLIDNVRNAVGNAIN